MDLVLIKELQLHCRIGLTEEERRNPQRLSLDLEIGISDWSGEDSPESLEQSVCYQSVTESLIKLAGSRKWVLLEAFISESIAMIFENFAPAKSIKILARKFVVDNTAWTGVEIQRNRTL